MIRRLLIVLMPLLAAHPDVLASQGREGYTPVFEEAPCPFELREDDAAGIHCGYVEVPEDWDAPESRPIRIAVAVLEARSKDERSEPVLWIRGGPSPGLELVPGLARSTIRETRDVILHDFRGIGHSDVICPDLGREYVRSLDLPVSESLDELRRVARECRAWAETHGVDLGTYRSRNMARDALAIMEALGYESWNLQTISYGTLVAFSIMRLQPEGLAAVGMMGLVPPDRERIETNAFARALDLMATHCARDPECAAAFPDLRADYEAFHARLEQQPMTIRLPRSDVFPDGEFAFGGRALQQLVFRFLYHRPRIAVLPMLVRETADGNTAPVASSLDLLSPEADRISGTTWAAQCSEAGVWADHFVVPEHPAAADDHRRIELATKCPALGVPARPAEEREPVGSDLPILLMVGEHDPISPPEYTHAAAQWLPNHHLFVHPGRGHESDACYHERIAAFFDDPTIRPEVDCPEESPDIPWVTDVRATPGIYRLAMRTLTGEYAPLVAGLGLPLAVMLTGAVGWPAGAVIRRLRRRERAAATRLERWGRIGAGALALLALVFVGLLAWMLTQTLGGENPIIVLIGLPGSAAPLFVIPWLLLAGSLALVAVTSAAWKQGAWSRWGRIHFALVAAASVGLTTMIFAWGLI